MHRLIAFKLFCILLLNFGTVISAVAQLNDTVKQQVKAPYGLNEKYQGIRKLDSATVEGNRSQIYVSNRRFSVGTSIIRVSEEALAKMQTSSLAEFIQQENAVYLKEYGRGMGAFISVRGTSSSHTTVDWNGQSLSVPTMGQTDLSHIPLYFFDAMEIHIGGSSALYGDGSIGGSIQLKTNPKWERGLHGDVLLSGGSFSSFLKELHLDILPKILKAEPAYCTLLH